MPFSICEFVYWLRRFNCDMVNYVENNYWWELSPWWISFRPALSRPVEFLKSCSRCCSLLLSSCCLSSVEKRDLSCRDDEKLSCTSSGVSSSCVHDKVVNSFRDDVKLSILCCCYLQPRHMNLHGGRRVWLCFPQRWRNRYLIPRVLPPSQKLLGLALRYWCWRRCCLAPS